MYRGGNWNNGANAGVFCLSGSASRAGSYTYIGFRPAFVRYSGDSGSLDNLGTEATDRQPEQKHRSIAKPDLLGRIRQTIARQLRKLYEAAGGEDPQDFEELAEKATNEELQKAAALSMTLAQVNASVDMYRQISQQLQLAMTTSITISKEVGGRE